MTRKKQRNGRARIFLRMRHWRIFPTPRHSRIFPKPRHSRGSALLAVLWLSAALAAIAFTVASNVRAETERTSTAIDSLRCYYLASASIDRALLHIQWGGAYYKQPMPVMRL